MSPLIYVDQSEILEGKADELEAAMAELAAFVEDGEPQLVLYCVFYSEDRTRMTVVHVHPDAASLDTHFEVASSRFPPVAQFIRLLAIDVYGEPSEHARRALERKAEAFGGATVRIHRPGAGFLRSSHATSATPRFDFPA